MFKSKKVKKLEEEIEELKAENERNKQNWNTDLRTIESSNASLAKGVQDLQEENEQLKNTISDVKELLNTISPGVRINAIKEIREIFGMGK